MTFMLNGLSLLGHAEIEELVFLAETKTIGGERACPLDGTFCESCEWGNILTVSPCQFPCRQRPMGSS